jgi:hypothetical protein
MSETPRMLRLMHNDLQGRLGDYAKRVLPAMQRSADEIEELGCKLAAMTAAKNKAVEALKDTRDFICRFDEMDDGEIAMSKKLSDLIAELEGVN